MYVVFQIAYLCLLMILFYVKLCVVQNFTYNQNWYLQRISSTSFVIRCTVNYYRVIILTKKRNYKQKNNLTSAFIIPNHHQFIFLFLRSVFRNTFLEIKNSMSSDSSSASLKSNADSGGTSLLSNLNNSRQIFLYYLYYIFLFKVVSSFFICLFACRNIIKFSIFFLLLPVLIE